MDQLEWELQNLSLMLRAQPTSSPATTEPIRDMVHQYRNTVCTAQKQMNLTNSLLQDIAIFNEHNSTKLEECLMDIETTLDLTSESQAKLAKANSRGLTCMLVTEAINSYIDSNCVMLTFTHTPQASWIYNSKRRNH